MDLNKEIKLSDLFKRPKKQKAPGSRSQAGGEAASARRSRRSSGSRSARLRSPPRGSSTTTAPEARAARATSRSRPGIVVAGEVRDVAGARQGARRFFSEQQAAAPGIRLGIGTNRVGVRALDVDRYRRRAPARQRCSLPRARGSLDPDRPGRPRLPRRQRDGRRRVGGISRRVVLAAAYKEPIDHYIEACRRGAARARRASTSRLSRCCARLAGNVDQRRRHRQRIVASRSVTIARRSRSPTATVCDFMRVSSGAARSSSPRSAGARAHRATKPSELKHRAVALDRRA